MMKRKLGCVALTSVLALTTVFIPNQPVVHTNYQVLAASDSELTVSDMPSNLKSSIEWVWTNRMVKEGSTTRKNLIFDQIFAENGTLNYVVRWQSTKSLSLETRQKMATMLQRQVNHWTEYLKDYDGWPYDEVKVNIVGWAVADESQILDKQADEMIYTDCTYDSLSEGTSIPSQLPNAPSELWTFEHFDNANYSYPGQSFNMYLWCTTGFEGGAGGDWGQRMSDDYILSTIDNDEVHILEHEMGHGFGLPDFYEEADRPDGGFPTNTIMWAGDSMTITEWDAWMLRYTWSQLKTDTSRFPEVEIPEVSESASPETTAVPEETASPEMTVSPTQSAETEVTVEPSETTTPVESTIPSEEASPEISSEITSAVPSVSVTTSANGTVGQQYKIGVNGTGTIDLSKLKIRYNYTKDDTKEQVLWCDNIGISYTQDPWYVSYTTSNVNTSFGDGYLDISFTKSYEMDNTGTATLAVRFNNADWSSYTNFAGGTVEVYYDGVLID